MRHSNHQRTLDGQIQTYTVRFQPGRFDGNKIKLRGGTFINRVTLKKKNPTNPHVGEKKIRRKGSQTEVGGIELHAQSKLSTLVIFFWKIILFIIFFKEESLTS